VQFSGLCELGNIAPFYFWFRLIGTMTHTPKVLHDPFKAFVDFSDLHILNSLRLRMCSVEKFPYVKFYQLAQRPSSCLFRKTFTVAILGSPMMCFFSVLHSSWINKWTVVNLQISSLVLAYKYSTVATTAPIDFIQHALPWAQELINHQVNSFHSKVKWRFQQFCYLNLLQHMGKCSALPSKVDARMIF
jgi:hypothetical protein